MPMMPGKSALLELLKQEGVRVLFGNPGTTELPLMDALAAEPELRYVLALQEAPAMGMADGYAQASGQCAFVNLHAAPGLGNAMGMLYDAQKGNAPILVTAGQHEQRFNFTEPLLWSDLPRIARPFVKWSEEVRRLQDLPRAIHRAVKTALAPPMGPVFLSLPGDILTASADLDLGKPSRVGTRIRGDASAIETAAAIIAAADSPVIFAGDCVAQSNALSEFVELAEAIGAPVYDEGMATRAMFPSSHHLYRGAIVRLPAAIRGILDQHDLLVSVGADLFTLSLPADIESVPENYNIVHLDTDAWELGKNYPENVSILGDPKATLPELTRAIKAARSAQQAAKAAKRLAHAMAEGEASLQKLRATADAMSERSPIHPLALMATIGRVLPDDAVVVDETISSGTGLRRFLKSDDAQSFFGGRGGGIGWGLPGAIGVKLALPDRPVVALIGDGSMMYTIQGLWTAAREKLRMVFIVINNYSYRILKQRTNNMKGLAQQNDLYVGMDLDNPRVDFVSVAKGFGLQAHTAKTLSDVAELLEQALETDGPTLIDVEVDRSWKPV
ncbi:MAG TPA: thiamine pyrophosphate-binding protein [Rhodopila sp.]|uniref:thiamine pyrophosphate-binding protein n=1 Tax=Rhodopila sp. TaxID=2480087 RepID=UPI002D074890|nr:thiamine pyrophosphate-binding protein [Rhodopila sp.]HVY18391.1 thiamine pyrophosphate-binding protein [Rhodopila sp.]